MPKFKYYHTKKPKVRPKINWKIKKLKKFLTRNTKILDIGCSTWGLYFSIKDIIKKTNYYDVDYNEYSVKLARKSGLNIEQCDIRKEDIPFREK